jgi:ATP-dependent Zn protease
MKYTLILLFSIILTSCASRHVKVDVVDIKKDSVAETKVVVTATEDKVKKDSTNIITSIDNNEITITPIDSSEAIIVDGKSYKNVVLKIKKSKTNTTYTNNKTESNNKRTDSVATTKVNKTEKVSGKNKIVDKKANYWFLVYWLILLLILYLLWRNRRRIFNVL